MHRYEHLHIGIFSDIRCDRADGFNDGTGAREEGPDRFQRKHPLKFLQFSSVSTPLKFLQFFTPLNFCNFPSECERALYAHQTGAVTVKALLRLYIKVPSNR